MEFGLKCVNGFQYILVMNVLDGLHHNGALDVDVVAKLACGKFSVGASESLGYGYSYLILSIHIVDLISQSPLLLVLGPFTPL